MNPLRIDHESTDGGSREPMTTIMMANSTVSRLILARSGRSDSGHYTCQASNKYGSDKMVTNLLVQGKFRDIILIKLLKQVE